MIETAEPDASRTDGALRRARDLLTQGDDEAAKQAYLDVLRVDPVHCGALTELGALAHASGHVSAAREAYHQAVHHHPHSTVAHVGYAYLLSEAGDAAAARSHYQAALAGDPDLPQAHQGLARVLTELGENAGEHWQKGFAGHAVVQRRYRGSGAGIPLLLLVAAVGGNVPTQHWIDDRVFAVTAVYADFFDAADALPPHAIMVNAIGDADLCGIALANAERIAARTTAPVINPPAAVRATGRETNARRLADVPDVITPRISPLSQDSVPRFPLLLRAPGFHTGQFFIRVETEDALPGAAASLPCNDPLAIEYFDTRGPDGLARKYRVMFIGGALYPLHLAISADWKVHHFTASMAGNPAFRAEERRFLGDMPAILGDRAMTALARIEATLGLDYAGVDFALRPDGSLLLFEANATMAIMPPEADPIWNYRRPAASSALAAARRLLPRNGPVP
ncbi:MAG: tetratricopeptide repeat protein [Rhodopila sp.]|jgi:predicted TPR repeat methyltransferase